ncbi:hypothetical protein LCGC14_0431050 [marine sediment metagenome]|uniref:Uncharacterized protein n=1 Tax=marine sediment metagenome TaxID=412755 RepID=A0A0F9SMZ8_9ZZZZ
MTSTAQQGILDALNDGWKLSKHYGVNTFCWIEKDGETQTVSLATLRALQGKKLIEIKGNDNFITTYRIRRKVYNGNY